MVNLRSIDINKFLNTGTGYLLLGILWLVFWLVPAFFLFQEDPRWGHNFAIPILFIIIGLAYNTKKISCQLIAVIASYITIPTFLAFWSWDTATIIASIFTIILVLLYGLERFRKTELINPNQRLKAWLKIHSMTFAYLGIVHMPLIFFLVRWFNPDPFLNYLPVEHHASTSIFNAMLFILTIFAIIERNIKKIGRINISKIGFIWSILMVIIPIIIIKIFGE